MLKLTYTETSFYLECLAQSLEEWVTQRVILALRVGQCLCVEPTTASFLLPVHLPGVEMLKAVVKTEDSEIIALCGCDHEYVEVTLRGSWLSNGSQDAEGVFVTAISEATEFFLYKLWQQAQHKASVMSE
ncbi:hypothetical protein SD81_010225 [Tolypothrix campylonemoides VB511288]|nr:hypothetical protein SD81_010225 [Tolypothrix campylonemoides VB511288]